MAEKGKGRGWYVQKQGAWSEDEITGLNDLGEWIAAEMRTMQMAYTGNCQGQGKATARAKVRAAVMAKVRAVTE